MALKFNITIPRRDFIMKMSGAFGSGITGVYGHSGAGKTTLFNIIAGFERPETGEITLNNRVLTDTDNRIHVPLNKRRVGVVFQDNMLFPHMSVKKNLNYGVKKNSHTYVTLPEICRLLDIDKIIDSKPQNISGGEAQRVALGRALLSSPELLLLDEPFNAVQYDLRSGILDYLKLLNEEFSIPTVVISHDYSDLRYLTDTFYFVENGRGKKRQHLKII